MKSLGPYDIEEELGRGASGVVYRAVHRIMKRPCALKLIDARSTGTRPERIRREAEAVARLGWHPHVVQIYDVGEVDGRTFIAMELIEGKDLGRVLEERGPLPEREALEIVRKVAIALDHAHCRGIVHRDIKPSNVLLNAEGEPRVSDFGLALDLEGATLTGEGDVVGTPNYMAPEQAQSQRAKIDRRTDVYALGATLFDLVVGRPAFQGSLLGVLTQIILDEPPRLRSVRPDASAGMEAVVAKAMEKAPERRYQSALELADDVSRLMAGEPTRARPEGVFGRARRFARRHRAVVVTLALVLLVAAVLGGALGVRSYRGRLRREQAARRVLEALAMEEGTTAHVEAMRDAVRLDPSWASSHVQLASALYVRAVEAYRDGAWDRYGADLESAVGALEDALAREPTSHAYGVAAFYVESLGDEARAAVLYRRAHELGPGTHTGENARAAACVLEGRWLEAAEAATLAIETEDADAMPFYRRSVAWLALGNLDDALADANLAIEKLMTDDWLLVQRARVRLARGELRQAGVDLHEALVLYPYSPAAYEALAALAAREGDPRRAARLLARAEGLTGGHVPAYLACEEEPWAAPAAEEGPAAPYLAEARARLERGDLRGAVAQASAALGLSPAHGPAYRVRAAAFRALGDQADALADEVWAERLDPGGGAGGGAGER